MNGDKRESVVVPETWSHLDLDAFSGVLLVIGAPDTGKSTFAHWLFGRLADAGRSLAFLDGDIGQSTLGPPATLTLSMPSGASSDSEKMAVLLHWFVGDVSPRGRMLPLVVGAGRLHQRALAAGVDTLVVDTTGLVGRAQGGVALKHALVDQLRPTTLFALQRVSELEPILVPLRRLSQRGGRSWPGFQVVELEVTAAIRPRDVTMRQAHRARTFRRYFSRAGVVRLSLRQRAVFDGATFAPRRLIALQDAAGFALALGVIASWDTTRDELSVYTPLADVERVASIRLGAIGVDVETGREFRPARG